MSTQTEIESEALLRSQLAAFLEPVRLRSDPYGRLLRRRRVSRLRRGAGAVVAMAIAAIGATSVALVPAGSSPEPPELIGSFRWIEELVDAAPRGAVAADEPFRRELEERVTDAVRSGEFHEDLVGIDGSLHTDQEVRLIFADDIDDRRIAVLALRLATPPDSPPYPSGSGRTRVLWLAGPRNAPASSLASAVTSSPAPAVDSGSSDARPFTIIRAGEPSPSGILPSPAGQAELAAANAGITYVGLAPPGCALLAAPATAPDAWAPEPTGSYIIRTPAAYRAEYWRVNCGGVVRQEGPRPAPTNGIPAELLEPALADLAAAGKTDEGLRGAVSLAAHSLADFRSFVTGPAHVRYAGPAAGLVLAEAAGTPNAVVLVAARVGSTWFCVFSVMASAANVGEGTWRVSVLDSDPFAPDATIAVSVTPRLAAPQVLALLTAAAARAELVAVDGTVIATSTVADTFVVLAVPDPYVIDGLTAPEGLRVVAYDAAGAVVSETPVTTGPSILPVDFSGDWD